MAAILENDRTLETRLARGKDALRCYPTFSSFPTVTKTLTFKTGVSAKSLRSKGVLFAWDEYEIFFKPIASHLASLWHWGLGQLSDCQFSFYLYFYLFPFFLFFTSISTCMLTRKFQLNTTSWKKQKQIVPREKNQSFTTALISFSNIMTVMMTMIINKTKAK